MASRIVIPSYHTGFYSPRRGGVARYPNLWRGCVGAWCPSLGATGSRLFDQSVYGNHGTLTNMDAATDWIISGDGRALDFDGTNDRAIVTSFPPLLTSPNARATFSIWFKRANNGTGVQAFTGKAANDWYMGIYENKLFYSAGGGNEYITPASTTFLDTASWHHFAGRHDGTTASIWIDGGLYHSETKTAWSHPSTAGLVNIGGRNNTDAWSWAGMLDDVRIYNRVLAPSEIAQLYRIGRGGAYALDDDDYKAAAAAGGFKAAWLAGARQTQIIGGGVK